MKKRKNNFSKLILFAIAIAAAFIVKENGALPANLTIPSQDGGVTVSFIDVGQGESILIQTPAKTVLIDAGENDKGDEVLDYLDSVGVKKLDFAIGTHPHSDHIGGLDTVLSQIDTAAVILPEIPLAIVPTTNTYLDLLQVIADKNIPIQPAIPGQILDLGDGAILEIIAPLAEYKDLNNMSVVCRLVYGSTAFLFTGDAEIAAEKDILKSLVPIEAQLLSAGHHGSKTSSSAAFLEIVDPDIAVISCGLDNSYGHPSRQVVERLFLYCHDDIFRTDLNGTIIAHSDGQTITMTTLKNREAL